MLIDSNLIIYATQPPHRLLRGWLDYCKIIRLENPAARDWDIAEMGSHE